LAIVGDTLPLVGELGADFTKHFYHRLFKAHPELLNLFNQTNQAKSTQPRRLLSTVATAATAAIETGELPGEAIEGICHKHAALHIQPAAYDIVGEHLLGSIQDLLTSDSKVLKAWGLLYHDIAKAFVTREQELYDEMVATPGGWLGRREFTLALKEKLSDTITRFTFVPTDGKPTQLFKAGRFTTIWTKVPANASGPHDDVAHYTEQPRHYTLNVPRNKDDAAHSMAISVKKQGLVSTLLHEATEGSKFDLSAPYGCFNLQGVEDLWLTEQNVPIIFLSGGVGITPVLAMLENIYTTRPATWLHSAMNGNVHGKTLPPRGCNSILCMLCHSPTLLHFSTMQPTGIDCAKSPPCVRELSRDASGTRIPSRMTENLEGIMTILPSTTFMDAWI
jgi:nitric oxide dioxygenase